ncbi:MAG TPA: DUF2637 domain-containing protein [Streptosporangiaceae bacterium]|nr:DUF2637 domain-containing protein [Streptosporangiaceae bacterium]
MNRPERIEDLTQVLILLVIAGMAGAASFTHVHDWTMHNSPPGTGGWFGWANAVISELTPTAAGLEIRRRKRQNRPIAYPMAVLILAAALSLTAQVAQARHSPTGWLVATVPALAFLALTKLVLARTPTAHSSSADAPRGQDHSEPAPSDHPALLEPVPPELLTGARMAAFTHRQATGQPITADTLASHLAIPHTLAGQLLHALDDTTEDSRPSVTSVNGTSYRPAGSRP